MRVLTDSDIRRLRLSNQWLAPRSDAHPLEVVEHLGALQAQELWSGQWSIGARSGRIDAAAVHRSGLDREILRTWPMRGTIHFVPANDAGWMLELGRTTAFRGVERRREFLKLDEADAIAAIDVLRDALVEGAPVARSECQQILEDAGVLKDRRHLYHLLWFASQHGATAIGPVLGKEPSYVNLDAWVTAPRELTRDEALAELAVRYFAGHGPAPQKELARWSALPAADVKRAVVGAAERLVTVATERGEMLMGAAIAEGLGAAPVDPPDPERGVLLLGGFDEYVLGYGDRSTMMTPEQAKLVVPGGNGVFRPTVVDDGVVIGTWKRATKKAHVDITVSPFGRLDARQRRGLERAGAEYGQFLGLEARITIAT